MYFGAVAIITCIIDYEEIYIRRIQQARPDTKAMPAVLDVAVDIGAEFAEDNRCAVPDKLVTEGVNVLTVTGVVARALLVTLDIDIGASILVVLAEEQLEKLPFPTP